MNKSVVCWAKAFKSRGACYTLRIYQAQTFLGGRLGFCLPSVHSGPEFRSELDKFISGDFKIATHHRKARNGKNVSY